MTVRVWFALSSWRVDDGPIETGARKFIQVGEPLAPNGQDWRLFLIPGRLVRFEAWYDEEPHAEVISKTGDWHFGEIEADPTDDSELAALSSDTSLEVSEPTEPWHVHTNQVVFAANGAKEDLAALLANISEPLAAGLQSPTTSGSITWFPHSTNLAPAPLGRGLQARVRLIHSRKESLLLIIPDFGTAYSRSLQGDHDESATALGNEVVSEFFATNVEPVANRLGIDFKPEKPATVVVPDRFRRERIVVDGLGDLIPTARVSYSEYSREPIFSECRYRLDRRPAPAFNGLEVGMRLSAEEAAEPKVHAMMTAFYKLAGAELAEAQTQLHERVWKLRHKKRRDFDPTDKSEIDDIWSELTFLRYGLVSGRNLTFQLYKPSKDWPLSVIFRGGATLTTIKSRS